MCSFANVWAHSFCCTFIVQAGRKFLCPVPQFQHSTDATPQLKTVRLSPVTLTVHACLAQCTLFENWCCTKVGMLTNASICVFKQSNWMLLIREERKRRRRRREEKEKKVSRAGIEPASAAPCQLGLDINRSDHSASCWLQCCHGFIVMFCYWPASLTQHVYSIRYWPLHQLCRAVIPCTFLVYDFIHQFCFFWKEAELSVGWPPCQNDSSKNFVFCKHVVNNVDIFFLSRIFFFFWINLVLPWTILLLVFEGP